MATMRRYLMALSSAVGAASVIVGAVVARSGALLGRFVAGVRDVVED